MLTIEFDKLRSAGWSPVRCAALAEAEGMSRLDVFKAIHVHWGAEAFTLDELTAHGGAYPSRSARAAATVGLAALVLNYPSASTDDVARFERLTGISRKVEALARADRTDDALRFYDRLHPDRLELTPRTETEARREIRALRVGCSSLSSVLIDTVEHHRWGWLFSPQPTDPGRLRSASRPPDRGGALLPILYDRFMGVPIETGLDEPPTAYVRRYERTGWPLPG